MQKKYLMKRLTTIITCISVVFFIASCEKFDSQIKGKVTYPSENNEERVASAALVYKYKVLKNNKEEKISSVLADSNGLYVFDYVTAGEWKIVAELTIGDTIYNGKSGVISTSGDDTKEVNIRLDTYDVSNNE